VADRRALVIVDVQVDLCPGGAAPVPRGDEVVKVLNEWIERFRGSGDRIYATRRSLPAGSPVFSSASGRSQPHCVQGTEGEGFHPSLRMPWDATVVTKGTAGEATVDSGFQGRTPDGRSFKAELRLRGVSHLFMGGLATEGAVKATALEAMKNGFKVTVIKDGVRPEDARPGDGEKALQELRKAGAKLA
jgi:nicotinamidase/pyrazinamidase